MGTQTSEQIFNKILDKENRDLSIHKKVQNKKGKYSPETGLPIPRTIQSTFDIDFKELTDLK